MKRNNIINPLIANIYSLSPMQEGMLYHNITDKESTGYVIQHVFALNGVIYEKIVREALNLLVKKYDVLRTAIVHEKLDKPRQIVLKNREAEYERIDLSGLSENNQEEELKKLTNSDLKRGFDLQKDSLLRIKYIVLGEDRYKMVWSYHHIIIDGWCLSLLFGDFTRYYNQLKNGMTEFEMERIVEDEKSQSAEYGEYIRWIEEQDKEESLFYWEELLSDYEEIAEIKPMIKPEPTDTQMEHIEIRLNEEITQKLLSLASESNVTINTVAEAAWGIILQKYSGTNDVVFGKVVSGRNADLRGIENIVGLFINTIPVRVKCNHDTNISDLLIGLQKQGTDGNNYAYTSLAEIQSLTKQKNELIKTLFVFENYYVKDEASKNSDFQFEMESAREQTNYPISVAAYFEANVLKLEILYNPNDFVKDEIQIILERIKKVLYIFAEDPKVKLYQINVLTEGEEERICNQFNNTNTPYPKYKTVVDLFEEQVNKTPENTAVIFQDQCFTYRELNYKANQLANRLREFGVAPDDFVAIISDRSLEMIAGIIGILKAGGAYVPIDPANPKDRIKFMIEDCQPKAILIYGTEVEAGDVPIVDLSDVNVWIGQSENLTKVNKQNDLAYCIYTSGTTGNPKGSLIEHKSIIRLVKNTNCIELDENSIIMQTGSMSFDASTLEVWGVLLNGGQLILAEKDIITNNSKLKACLEDYKVNTMWLTSSLYNQMIQSDQTMFDCLKYLLIGGEKLSEKHVRMFLNRKTSVKLINGYGPTENTTFTTTYEIPDQFHMIPIGKPISNTQVYILERDKLCGIGIPGELCIAGEGLARGYLNRPELTAEKFISHPLTTGNLYRSGDLARWLPDGTIEYLGRVDEQVKIRGFRIELGEIENNIRKIDQVKDGAVLVQENESGEKSICAYIVSDEKLSLSHIRSKLCDSLPEYMIPAYMMQINSIPVTRNGKLDRRALPQIVTKSEQKYVAPRNNKEKILCQVFGEILGIETVGVKDSFFELGGDSIKAIRIVSKMRNAGYGLSVKEIMNKYTVEAIAYAVEESNEKQYEQNEVTGKVLPTPIILAFKAWNLKKPHHFNQDVMIKINTDDELQIQKALNAIAVHHDMIRAVYINGGLEIRNSYQGRLYDFKVYNYRNMENASKQIDMECSKLQSSIDLEKGPLMKTALFKTRQGNYLMICLHHLVVDGISWRIILEDFQTAITQMQKGQKIVLPVKAASFIEWSEAIGAYKESGQLNKEKSYWKQVTDKMKDTGLSLCKDGNKRGYKDLIITFDKSETDNLIHRAGKAFHTEINDLLISALGMSVWEMTGQASVSIGLEGHGREEIHKKMDIDRTVGWFTSMYPIVLDCSGDCKESIIATKEMLRKVPNHGIGYGLLKDELHETETDILFNYLGQMDAESMENKAVYYSTGKSSAEENVISDGISFNGIVTDGKLSFTVSYNRSKYSDQTIKDFGDLYKKYLKQNISFCMDQKESIKTASDYGAIDLTNIDLSIVNNRFGHSMIYDIHSLTPLQEGMLYHNMADKRMTGYMIQNVFVLTGEIQEQRIVQALRLLVTRHDALRTAIVYENLERSRQVVLKTREMQYESIDLSGLCQSDQEKRIEEIKKSDVNLGFDLQKDPLIRVKYIFLGLNNHKMIWSYHHIIIDGWCLSILFSDFIKYYNKLYNGINITELEQIVSEERDCTVRYGEYIKWLENQNRELGLLYWRELLSDYEETAEISPMEKPEPSNVQMERLEIKLSEEESKMLMDLAVMANVTINTVAEAAWGIVLQKYGGINDAVFGKVVSGRNANVKGIENIVGLFINTIPVRVKCDNETTVEILLKQLQVQGNEGNNYAYCSLAEIQGLTVQKNDLIKTLFVFENYYVQGQQEECKEGLQMSMESAREQTNYAISVSGFYDGNTLGFDILYNPNEYMETEIKDIIFRIKAVLNAFVKKPHEKIHLLDTTIEGEKEKILGVFNCTDSDYPKDKTVIGLFEEQVGKSPENIAVVFEDQELTYRVLNDKANLVAEKLRAIGVKPDDFVAIIAERSIEMVIGIIGILKASGAYVPIDSTYPVERIQFMIKDCQPKAILTYKAEIDKMELPILNLESIKVWEERLGNLPILNKPEDLAYCIYTSGTTGKPKGSLIENKSIVRLVRNTNFIELDEKSIIMQTGSMSFDASTLEVWGALLNGGKLILAETDIITNHVKLKNCLIKYKVNTMWLTSSLFNQMIQFDSEMFDNLNYLLIGGEKLSEDHVRILKNRNTSVKLINGYGPTENTTFTTTYEIPSQFDYIPIGKPIANTKAYVLKQGRLCGIGIPGELCMAGAGLARGYLNRPELTAEKFIDNPFGEGKLYCSGDLTKWLPDGNIAYLGRVDEQVKIRGFRIEPGEIESALRSLKNIIDAAVIVRDDHGDKSIHGYFVSGIEMKVSEIRNALSKSLPDYMIPAHMMQIESIPVTRNGKLDKKELPFIESKSEKEYVAPRSKKEKAVCNAFSEILGMEKVGVKDNFFELGGDSIKAIRIVSKMRVFGYEVTVKDIMKEYTAERIAQTVLASDDNHYEQDEVNGKVVSTPIICEFESWKLKMPNHFNQDVLIKVETDDEVKIRKVLDSIAIHHDMIRAVYRDGSLEVLNSHESKLYDLEIFDYNGVSHGTVLMETECSKIQSSIDLENGPLMKCALFKINGECHLMICLHHLVVDGVSLRILLEDFQTAMKQVQEAREIALPLKTASFKAWGEALEEYRNSRQLKKERNYWEKVISQMKGNKIRLKKDGFSGNHEDIVISFTPEVTEKLIHQAGKAFYTEINDLLISAIGMSVKKLTGQDRVSVILEGHGREEIHKKVDIDRTVGWFTSMYPIVVDCSDDIRFSIISVKEMLRSIPSHGIGYGLLKDEFEEIKAEISFNYLGQMDSESKSNQAVYYSTGKSSADENHTPDHISFNGLITDGTLKFTMTYDNGTFSAETMNRLAKLYKESLIESVEYCVIQKESIKTASDYSTDHLTYPDLIHLYKRYKKLSSIDDIHSLTPMQEGMLYHHIADKKSTGYVIQNVFTLKGHIYEDKILQALELLMMRHSVLRTAIVYEQLSKPKQIVFKSRTVEYEKIDLSYMTEMEQKKQVIKLSKEDVKRGFDLQNDVLLRVKYVVLDKNRSKMIWSYHHIIIDGWCLSLLFGDFTRYYSQLKHGMKYSEMRQLVSGEKKETAEFGEYIKWLGRQDMDKGLSYWEELLADYEETAEIKPMRMPEPTDVQMKRIDYNLTQEESEKLLNLAINSNVTINTVAEAAWGMVLQKYCGTNDVVFGKVVSGRNANIKGIENIVGLFINTIPVRVKSDNQMTVVELLKMVQEQGGEGNNYAYCSLAEIQGLTQQKSKLIKTLFVFENYYVKEKSDGHKELEFDMESAREQTNYAISVSAYFDGKTISFDILYNPSEYCKSEIEIVLTRIEKVLHEFVLNPNGKVQEISMITDAERKQILNEFNNTYLEYPKDKTIIDLFEEQVEKMPQNMAIVFEEQQLTYEELNQRVNQLARKLRSLGLQKDDFVAVIAERGIEMIVGIYGIMKAGGAYIPIDPTYPKDRLNYILKDCQPKAILTYKAESEDTHVPVIDLENPHLWKGDSSNLVKVNESEDLAYCIYTSGTTGKPKGVLIKHKGVSSMRSYLLDLYKVTEKDNVLQFANYVFDASVWEMSISLLTGAKLVLVSTETISDIGKFNEYVHKNKITITLLPPQYYLQSSISGLRVLTTGGSATNLDVTKKAGNNNRYINAYGPTENTVLATHWELKESSGLPQISIGKPISNTQIYILDGTNLCGIGIQGELCIAGEGLARGYLNRPDLSSEKFIDNPFGEGKLYRSGDLAKWLPDGNIEYLGRIDEQVKIRGFRIELGEIEATLRSIENVTDAAVIARDDYNGNKAIHAYYVSYGTINIPDIKERLGKSLPQYMIPAYIHELESIPVTRSGKLDKSALPQPDINLFRMKNKFKAAKNDYERDLTAIWKNILKLNEIGVNDNFFELGGNSLLITVMLSQIQEKYQGIVKVGDIFANPTISRLAEHIELNNMGVLRCREISFPNAYFKQSNKRLANRVFSYRDEGVLQQDMKSLYDQSESQLYELLMFVHSYLISDITGQKEITICTVNKKDYCSFELDLKGINDLNIYMDIVKKNYLKAPKLQKANVKTESKPKGLIPIFLYQFSGNDLYKTFSDFSISFYMEEDAVTFSVEVFNKKISEKSMCELLENFVKMSKNLCDISRKQELIMN